MKILQNIQKYARTLLVAALAVTIASAPVLVSAQQVTTRSIALSSSSASATDVTYKVDFTSVQAAGAFVIDFCSNTPILGQTCTAPNGFDVAGAESATSGFTDVADLDANTVRVTGTIGATSAISVTIDGINNPSDAGTMYARIVTYTDATDANGYTSADPDAVGTHLDDGSVAIAITPTIGVSGSVLESLVFCVAKVAVTANCANASANPPVLTLGETVGTTVALSPGVLSTGNLYAQLSTNALSGSVVSLKTSTTNCGGLMRAGSTDCDIQPALADGIDAANGDAQFGLKVTAAADTGTNPGGVLQATNGYNGTTYTLNYAAGNATGVTSTYGDQVLNTNNAPANGKNVQLTFGASAQNDTPAGTYAADISMIATGKF